MLLSKSVEPYVCKAHWLVGARTNLIDKIVPALEFIYLPPTTVSGGHISLNLTTGKQSTFDATRRPLNSLLHRYVRKDHGASPTTGVIADFREYWPQNWAHALIYHIPLAAFITESLEEEVTFILPFHMPKYVLRLFDYFAFKYQLTDRAVTGRLCRHSVSHSNCLRSARRSLISTLIEGLDAKREKLTSNNLPEKVFISRKDTRRLKNEAEIEKMLTKLGYEMVYPEEFSVAQQVELYNCASHIVAIHGAGIAPLLYRSPSRPPVQMVELNSAGQMTTAFRVLADQVGGDYVGTRGTIPPKYMENAYNFSRTFIQHEMDDFEADPASIEAALAILEAGGPPGLRTRVPLS